MSWDEKIDTAGKMVDLAIRAEVHAFALIVLGVVVAFKQHELGSGMVMTGLGIFKGR